MEPQFSIVLPCYNEAESLPALFTRFSAILEQRHDVEVVFVNNGSKDSSKAVFETQLSFPGRLWARVVDVPVNKGYGFGIMSGLRAARGAYIGWTHADTQYDPAIVLQGFALLKASADPEHAFLTGRRIQRPLLDNLFTLGMTCVASMCLGVWVSDINAQPKLFPRAFLQDLANPPDDFSLDLYALFIARKKGYVIQKMDVVFGRRDFGEAKGGGSLALKWKLSRRTWAFIRELRRRIRSGHI
ncbi:MAG TPA: glycosyltransferase family 2 protein [Candidatus Methylacidiphilales bacterium]|nr:glycosyltransferase family 2 protein [Candidatus Methylacidiphilales bacterium]